MIRDTQADPVSARIECALRAVVPLLDESLGLPAAADLVRRGQMRERELAARRLARWHGWMRSLALGVVGLAVAAALYATEPRWGGWLLAPLLGNPPLPGIGDAAVVAGAVFTASAAIVWVSQQFADE